MKNLLNFLKPGIALGAICLISGNANAETYPSIEDLLQNKYQVVVGEFQLNDDTYEDFFKAEFDFTLTGTDDSPILNGFLYSTNRINCEYDPQTGIFTDKQLTLKPTGTSWLAISPSPEGFNGNITALKGNLLKFQIDEEGDITIPDFEIGTYTANQAGLTKVIASYKDIKVTILGKDYSESEPQKDFSGTYSFTGTKYDFTGEGDPVISALDFNLVISYTDTPIVKGQQNQLVEIAGYKLSEEDIQYKNLLYTIEDNTITYEAAPNNGVLWETVDDIDENSYTSGYLFGSESTKEWIQGSPTIVFTKNDDGSYSLKPFTIWHRYPVESGNPENKTIEYKVDLVFLWTSEEYVPPVVDDPEPSKFYGEYSFNGTFYNYADGEISETYDGFFDLVINEQGQATTIGGYQLTLADIEAGRNQGEDKENTFVLTTGENTGLQWPNAVQNTTVLLGSASVEKYTEGEEIILTVNENETYSLTPFTGWRVNEDGTYTLLFKWDDTPYIAPVKPSIEIISPLFDPNIQGEPTVTFTTKFFNLDLDSVDEFIANFSYKDANGETKDMAYAASVENSMATVILKGLEEGVYNFEIVLIAMSDGEPLVTSNVITLPVDYSGIEVLNKENSNVRYFNLNGIEISQPIKGNIYIKIENGKAVKQIVQ